MKKLEYGDCKVIFDIDKGVGGLSLSINDYNSNGGLRLAGPKPYGGSVVYKRFHVDLFELKEMLKAIESEYKREQRKTERDGRSDE